MCYLVVIRHQPDERSTTMDDYFIMFYVNGAPADGPSKFKWDSLHLTLIPFLRMEQTSIPTLQVALSEVANNHLAFTLQTGEVDRLGARKNIRVRKLTDTAGEALSLHQQLLATVTKFGVIAEQSEFTGENFNPHLTVKESKDTFTEVAVDSFTLVRHIGGLGKNKMRVLGTWNLN
jgi:2'-5' RNA ligase